MASGDRDWLWMLGAGALALVAIAFTLPSSPLCAWGRPAQERVLMKEVPEVVRAVATQTIGPLDDCFAIREREHGKVRWEIERTAESGVTSVVVSDEGELLEVERPVAVATLPKRVRDAVAAAFPKSAILQAETVESRHFEFTLSVDGKKREVKVDLDGRIMGAEGSAISEGGEDDEGDDDERK